MSIKGYKHNKSTRQHTPSTEEAGMEQANPVVKGKAQFEVPKASQYERGRDPELIWKDKYGNDDREETLKVDIRSLYRHEHISPELLIKQLYSIKENKDGQGDLFAAFGNHFDIDELEKPTSYYSHTDRWTNRLIQGDSLLVMGSLLEREGMAGQVQTIFFDPPYGIKYGSNWQIKINSRNVKDGDDDLTPEPEQIKAFRDTWELGIHSYLSYLRDRLLIARELLTDSGACFVQISDENVHLLRNIMDEVFGSENFISIIKFRKKTMPLGARFLEEISDFILFYAKDKEKLKYRQLYTQSIVEGDSHWNYYELPDGKRVKMTGEEISNHKLLPKGADPVRYVAMHPIGFDPKRVFPIEINGRVFLPPKGKSWKSDPDGIDRLKTLKRIEPYNDGKTLNYILKLSDYPISPLSSLWSETSAPVNIQYVVETNTNVIQRCILMTTDPGDLVLDPTCGGGTSAYVAEQWGRRWITIDTSRIALNIAKQRLMTAVFPYYYLYDEVNSEYLFDKDSNKYKVKLKYNGKNGHSDIRNGFVYEKVPHITLKSLANDEPAEDETLYDKPYEDKKRIRVAGPFTVETLQNYEPTAPSDLDKSLTEGNKLEDEERFQRTVFERLVSAGINNGDKKEHTKFTRVDPVSSSLYLHAEGFYQTARGEAKAYIHLGPQFGTVSKRTVNEAVKECRNRGDADWLIIMGFSFESDIATGEQSTSMGSFVVTKCRLHDDFLQAGLKKKPNASSGSFVTIGEPDIALHQDKKAKTVQVEILGLDIYDPIKDQVNARDRADIAYWMMDDDYDGSNFIVKQVFFCGGDDEFDKWKKALEKTVKVEIDDEAFARLYGHFSHPVEYRKGKKIAVRVISQFGEESTKVIEVK
ncbi:MAG: site-specific DNA-methyltransferase [Bacteroidetes bacterium]|nr:site-specific DNA-methyltransferase [Bacteroidota bacterium]